MTTRAQQSGSRRSLVTSTALVVALLVAATVWRQPLFAWFTGAPLGGSEGKPGATVAGSSSVQAMARTPGEVDHYTCSMHPSVKQKAPGKCPICGMDLIPVSKEQQEQGVVMIDEARRQLIGVRTAPVVEAPMRSVFRAVGQVAYDEGGARRRKPQGAWLDHEALRESDGATRRKGPDAVHDVQPQLYSAEQDFLLGMQKAAASVSAGDSGPHRTELPRSGVASATPFLGLTDAQIGATLATASRRRISRSRRPRAAFVIEKNVVEGAAVDAGMRLYRSQP
jgi:Cu(I)/Ag(I) efflux system membrane fusion protein